MYWSRIVSLFLPQNVDFCLVAVLCCSHSVHHVTLAPIGYSHSNNVIIINDAIIVHIHCTSKKSDD